MNINDDIRLVCDITRPGSQEQVAAQERVFAAARLAEATEKGNAVLRRKLVEWEEAWDALRVRLVPPGYLNTQSIRDAMHDFDPRNASTHKPRPDNLFCEFGGAW